MLTGKMVRVRYAGNRVIPRYLDAGDGNWLEVAEALLELFRNQEGRTRGPLEEDVRAAFGADPDQLVHQGLVRLLHSRCEFEVVSERPPEEIRNAVFQRAAHARAASKEEPGRPRFNRDAIMHDVATELALAAEAVERCLFADLASEQRLVRFKDTTARRLLERYNVALAQAILLRSTRVHITIRGESPARYRQLLRLMKFHRLVSEIEQPAPETCQFHLDGPLSLFTATQKYGLQLALFVPALLACRDFDMQADLLWGPQRKPKLFTLSSAEGLVSHTADTGMHVPAEMAMFVELFRKKVTDWDIVEETAIFRLPEGFWVPDFLLIERRTGRGVYLEVLGYWRRSSAERHLERLRDGAPEPFLLAVSDRLRIDDAELEGLPAGIHRFRQMPLPDEIVRLAKEVLAACSRRATGLPCVPKEQ